MIESSASISNLSNNGLANSINRSTALYITASNKSIHITGIRTNTSLHLDKFLVGSDFLCKNITEINIEIYIIIS